MNDLDAAGHGRVRLHFTPSAKEIRVPPGVTVFDAASWNGIAIDSTCGGHGTCRKCLVRIESGDVPVSSLDVRAFSAEQLREGWRLACRANATTDLRVEVPPLVTRPKAATVGVGRQVILRPAIQKRYVQLLIKRATQNAVLNLALAEKYGARILPVTQSTDVSAVEVHASPAEGTA